MVFVVLTAICCAANRDPNPICMGVPMGMTLAGAGSRTANPLDLLEELASTQGWPHMRAADDEFVTEPSRRWCAYKLHFIWQKDLDALHLHCSIEIKVPEAKRRDINDLLASINERLWLGHFEVAADDPMPTFRHTLLTRGQFAPGVEQLEDLVEVALDECDRYYPAFQFVLWAGHPPDEAISAALIDTVGEA